MAKLCPFVACCYCYTWSSCLLIPVHMQSRLYIDIFKCNTLSYCIGPCKPVLLLTFVLSRGDSALGRVRAGSQRGDVVIQRPHTQSIVELWNDEVLKHYLKLLPKHWVDCCLLIYKIPLFIKLAFKTLPVYQVLLLHVLGKPPFIASRLSV